VSDRSQSYANHVRIAPGFHYGVLGVFVLNLVWSVYRLYSRPDLAGVVEALMAVALLGLLFYTRRFALAVHARDQAADPGLAGRSPSRVRARRGGRSRPLPGESRAREVVLPAAASLMSAGAVLFYPFRAGNFLSLKCPKACGARDRGRFPAAGSVTPNVNMQKAFIVLAGPVRLLLFRVA
jgi:hypothetical protein